MALSIKFPEFDILYNQAISNNADLILDDATRITFTTLSDKHIRNIYMIITHYAYLENNKNLSKIYPITQKNKKIILHYNGNSDGKGILYDINNFPKILEKMIVLYINNNMFK